MANMNDRYMEEYEAARSGRPSIQETLTKAQEQERKKKRHRYEKIGAALLVLIGALSWYFFYYTQTPQYTVKQIQKAVQQHDAVTVHQKVDMDGLLSKSTDAIRDAEWELNPDSEFTEEDKPEFIKHMKEVIDNGILTGDWTDSYQKTHPERALKVNLGDLSLTEIRDVKTQKDEALVNVKMKNDASKSDDILVLRLRKDKKGWKLEEIMNLKWYYTKILKGEGMTKKENAPTPGTDAALYEAVKNKIAEEVPEAKVILNQLPQASGTKGTKEITPEDAKKVEDAAQKMQTILEKPVAGKVLRSLLEHQDELQAKTQQLLEKVQNGNNTKEIVDQLKQNETLLEWGNKILTWVINNL
ncbi:DUF2939 domain-containing protein [Acidaminococcus intestini]|uniref:DUF2939 domain-containing protein n=1 Tax=Acidaminococcus intestini TaxID=187327 RepID=UPI001D07C91F|nr:DUF2939 domain-containing protein [Acidaminococcus intestini]MCB7082535.1 DUF2939 domain-containing protein [Acidaminococcus intestini]